MCKKLEDIERFRHPEIGQASKSSESLEQIASAPNLHFVSVTIQKSGNLAFKI
jgi:hypothetical protein